MILVVFIDASDVLTSHEIPIYRYIWTINLILYSGYQNCTILKILIFYVQC